mmetsp:Transcript_50188/g.108016  ORF Transcript_50188/g.108016 Transcript_50188/m.108016 type:complete len:267 (-) Transcript_50188:133-933(-)
MFSFQDPIHPRLPLLEPSPEPVSMMIDGDSPGRQMDEDFQEEESSIEFEYSMDWCLGQEEETEMDEESSIECEYSIDWSMGLLGSAASSSIGDTEMPPVMAEPVLVPVPVSVPVPVPVLPQQPYCSPTPVPSLRHKISKSSLNAFLAALAAAAAAVPLPDWDDDDELLLMSPRPCAKQSLPPTKPQPQAQVPPLPLCAATPAASFNMDDISEVATPRPPALCSARANKKLTPKRFGIRGSPCRKDRRRIWEKPHRDDVAKYLLAVG